MQQRVACLLLLALLSLSAAQNVRIPLEFLRHFGVGGKAPDPSFKSPKVDGEAIRKPVVLIPPLAGTQLYGKLDKSKREPYFFCEKHDDWHLVWMSVVDLFPLIIDCWADNLQLAYDEASQSYVPPEGVEIRPGEGIQAVEYVDPSPEFRSRSIVYGHVVDLLKSQNYTVDVDLTAHPYDWRMGPDSYFKENGTYAQLKTRIENIVEANNGRKAVLLSFSLGSPYTNLFLTDYVDAAWKAKYVDTFFSVSGVFAGTPTVLRYMLAPDNWDGSLPSYTSNVFSKLVQSIPSGSWVTPVEKVYGNSVLIASPDGNFTAANQADALRAAGNGATADTIGRMRKYEPSKDPGVHVECLYAHDVPTITSMVFDAPLKEHKPPTEILGDGDGTVPTESLLRCNDWNDVTITTVANVTHSDLINDATTFEKLLKAVIMPN